MNQEEPGDSTITRTAYGYKARIELDYQGYIECTFPTHEQAVDYIAETKERLL